MNDQYMAGGNRPAALDLTQAEFTGPDRHRNREHGEGYRVIGAGTCQQVIESEIIFAPPEKDRVMEVIKIETELELKEVKVRANTVCIDGCIHKGIIYKTVKALRGKDDKDDKQDKNDKDDDKDKKDGKDNKDGKDDKNGKDNKDEKDKKKDKPACKIIKTHPIAVDGVVRHTTVWIPFRCFANVNGAQEGDECDVVSCDLITDAGSSTKIPYEEDDACEKTDDMVCLPDFIKGVIEKDLIKIAVKVKR